MDVIILPPLRGHVIIASSLREARTLRRVRHGTHPHAAKTHCPHGHEYTDENTGYVRTNKNKSIVSRRCLTCHRESTRRRRAKEKQS